MRLCKITAPDPAAPRECAAPKPKSGSGRAAFGTKTPRSLANRWAKIGPLRGAAQFSPLGRKSEITQQKSEVKRMNKDV